MPIEEIMQDECQLLAPNGFPLHVTSGQAFIIGFAYALTSLCGVSVPSTNSYLAKISASKNFTPKFDLLTRALIFLELPLFLLLL